ncbi:MAG TPA: ClpXP protease specificity-enhancing factor [Aquabacterium sp.]|uniref:ClpXP protease specificity-enhancing factor n=1 Tax=Aquabacterium sp. TaxID=1872578 RepID=UPI002E375E90|nr:ClpXP protease specificity-enhancing factor [Aquabacterium sp.]HEX5372754.1 ClpXP protease specificity-enhancing factor [Aquabacterium sp.]
MTTPTDSDVQGTSTRPYLIRALHDWCTDNGFTPYLAVYVDKTVQVPREYVKNNEIVLNVSFDATSQLQLGNEYIEFKARFGGVARDILVPIDHVIAIYARENGQGMAFPVPTPEEESATSSNDEGGASESRKTGGIRLASAPVAEPDHGDGSEAETADVAAADEPSDPEPPTTTPSGGRPSLRRIK